MPGHHHRLCAEHHEAILGLANDLEAALASANLVAEEGEVRERLSRLVGKLNVHLGMEERAVYPALRATGEPDVLATAERFEAGMHGLRGALKSFAADWLTPGAMGSDPVRFVSETSMVVGALRRRIAAEDDELAPLVARLGG